MNRIDELKSLIENCKKTIESSEKEIEMLKPKEPVFERVKKDKSYYLLGDFSGKIIAHHIPDDGSEIHKKRFENNNYFLTKERAEEVANRINFLLKLERLHDIYCPDYKPNWNNEWESKFYIFYNISYKKYQYGVTYWTPYCPNIYFNSEETAEKVCEILNKDEENE